MRKCIIGRRPGPNLIDQKGKTVGHWIVERRAPNDAHGNAFWWARCPCGKRVRKDGRLLRKRPWILCSYACPTLMVGLKFHHLTVIRRATNDRFSKSRWLCRCDCGKTIRVPKSTLRLKARRACSKRCESLKPSLVGRKFGLYTVVAMARQPRGKRGGIFWRCRCACGRIRIKSMRQIGEHNSCGCANLIGKARRARNSLVHRYKDHAKSLGLPYELSRETIARLFRMPCHYCGLSPSQGYRNHTTDNKPFWYSGIDRKDSRLGYVKGNVVSCCKVCNRLKSSLPYKEFIRWVRAVWRYRARPSLCVDER